MENKKVSNLDDALKHFSDSTDPLICVNGVMEIHVNSREEAKQVYAETIGGPQEDENDGKGSDVGEGSGSGQQPAEVIVDPNPTAPEVSEAPGSEELVVEEEIPADAVAE